MIVARWVAVLGLTKISINVFLPGLVWIFSIYVSARRLTSR
jgi:hypothetical protein